MAVGGEGTQCHGAIFYTSSPGAEIRRIVIYDMAIFKKRAH